MPITRDDLAEALASTNTQRSCEVRDDPAPGEATKVTDRGWRVGVTPEQCLAKRAELGAAV